MTLRLGLLAIILFLPELASRDSARAQESFPVVRSARSGAWSAASTWEGGRVPGAGARILIREGHSVLYDVISDQPIRLIHVAGTLSFARDRDTRLDVALIKIQPGEDVSEDGFKCSAHAPESKAAVGPGPALLVGTADEPIAPNHSALIRLVFFDGMDKDSCPAIACCGGRMDFGGTPLSRTWVKLGAPAKAGDTRITLAEKVTGWRAGDRVILTGTERQRKVAKEPAKPTFKKSVRDLTQTEERIVRTVEDQALVVDPPLAYDHTCQGSYRGDVANLSRNVIVESADPSVARGHTVYHHGSAGSIRYAEFRHLGKEGVLGRYSLHFHLVGNSMRGSSVLGASIWDSGNRWITIHGTNYLVVRDCVGYQSVGHGFFMEDGTEVFNVLDRNLAVQAYTTQPLPKQVLPFDRNDGSGFWWANSLNSFTRNVAAECDEYGYFYQTGKKAAFDFTLPVLQPDGSTKLVDIRTLPFIRFEDNEAHCQRRHAFNFGGSDKIVGNDLGVDLGIGPDERHPFVIRNFRAWNDHWSIFPAAPCLLLEHADLYDGDYGFWRPVYDRHAYRAVSNVKMLQKLEIFPVGSAPKEIGFPKPLEPVDDFPPATIVTSVGKPSGGKRIVRGTTIDNGDVRRVLVNDLEARATAPNFIEWEVEVAEPASGTLWARAQDRAGNVERQPHVVILK